MLRTPRSVEKITSKILIFEGRMQKNNRAGGAEYQDRIQTEELEDMFGVTSFKFPYID